MKVVAAILKHKGDQVITVDPMLPMPRVLERMVEHRIGAVVVLDDEGQLCGIVSERDIVRGLASSGAHALDMTASQLMTRNLQVAHRHTTVAEAMMMMTNGRFRHLPVMEGNVLVGLISIGDVVKARIMEQEDEVDSLRAYVGSA
jgi:CBS domain-containing protein